MTTMMILALGCLIGTSDSMCLKWIHFSGKTALLLSIPRFRKWQNHPPSCSSPGVVFDFFFLTPHTITHHVLLILPLKMPLNLPTSLHLHCHHPPLSHDHLSPQRLQQPLSRAHSNPPPPPAKSHSCLVYFHWHQKHL